MGARSRRWSSPILERRSLLIPLSFLPVLLLASAFPTQAVSCGGSNLTYSETGNDSATESGQSK